MKTRDYCFDHCRHLDICILYLSTHPYGGPTAECRDSLETDAGEVSERFLELERKVKWLYGTMSYLRGQLKGQNAYIQKNLKEGRFSSGGISQVSN